MKAFTEAHDDRSGLHRRAVAALARIRNQHDPAQHAERLKEIYARANETTSMKDGKA